MDLLTLLIFKVQMKKTIKAFDKKKTEGTQEKADINEGAVPAYLLDRKDRTEGKALSQQVKQKRQDKAAKFNVPIPKVKMQSENEVFREVKSGKRGKSWKRMVTKVSYQINMFVFPKVFIFYYSDFPPSWIFLIS